MSARTRPAALCLSLATCLLPPATALGQNSDPPTTLAPQETSPEPSDAQKQSKPPTPPPPPAIAPAAVSTAPASKPKLDILSPRARGGDGTAYTLAPRQFELKADFLGINGSDVYGSLGVAYGLGHGLELGMNVLHASVGLLNLRAEWNFIEKGPWASSIHFAPTWGHGEWVWLAPRDFISNIDLIVLPFALTTSYQPNRWFGADLGASFTDVEVIGNASGESLVFDANIALREFALRPQFRITVHRRLTTFVSAHLPLWARLPGSVSAEVEVEPGVLVGGETAGSKSVPFEDLYRVTVGARGMISERTFFTFAVNHGDTSKVLYGSRLYPRVSFEFKF